MGAFLSRRGAVLGAVSVVGAVRAIRTPAGAQVAVLSANDARLVELADAMSTDELGYDDLICRYSELEIEAAETPADGPVGALAKVRLCQSPTARGCADFGHLLSAVDDVWRLFGKGALS